MLFKDKTALQSIPPEATPIQLLPVHYNVFCGNRRCLPKQNLWCGEFFTETWIMKESMILTATALILVAVCVDWTKGQQRGSFNFAKKTGGEREGDLTPSAIAGVSIACVAGIAGLGVTMFFCFYVYRQQKQQDSFNSSFDPARKV